MSDEPKDYLLMLMNAQVLDPVERAIVAGVDGAAAKHYAITKSVVAELVEALDGLTMAVKAEVDEKGGGGYLLARLFDARAAIQKAKTQGSTAVQRQ